MFSFLAFTWPAMLASVVTDSAGKIGGASGQLTAAQTRLQAALTPAITHNPVGANCSGSGAQLQALHGEALHGVQALCVHPWMPGIGEGDSYLRYLSPANAVEIAARKFMDGADFNKPKHTVECVCIVVSAIAHKDFANALAALTAVLPLPDLMMCYHRAMQLTTAEKDKVILPDAAINSRWKTRKTGGVGRTAQSVAAVSELVAQAAGYESGALTPDQEVIALITKKKSVITETQAAINTLASSFTGGAAKGAFISAKSPQQIKNELLSSGLGHEEPLACCVVVSAPAGNLALLREMLGL